MPEKRRLGMSSIPSRCGDGVAGKASAQTFLGRLPSGLRGIRSFGEFPRYGAPLDFAPLPWRRLCRHRDSPRLAPEAWPACQILGAFFKSKFLFHSLRFAGLAATLVLAGLAQVTLGRWTHSVMLR